MWKLGQKLVYVGSDRPINIMVPCIKKGEIVTFDGYDSINYINTIEYPTISSHVEGFRPIQESAISELCNSFVEIQEKLDVEVEELV